MIPVPPHILLVADDGPDRDRATQTLGDPRVAQELRLLADDGAPADLAVEDEEDGHEQARSGVAADVAPRCTVLCASTVAEACDVLATTAVDCIVVDVELSDGGAELSDGDVELSDGGAEAIRRLRAHAPLVGLVALISEDDPRLAAAARRRGADEHVAKADQDAATLGRAVRHAIELSRLEAARREAADAYAFQARVLHASDRAIVVTDAQGIVLQWNRGAEKLYGWSTEEAVGHQVGGLIRSDGGLEQAAEIWAELRAGRSWTGDYWVRHRDNTLFPILVSDTPILDDEGNLVAIIAVSADLTARKRAEERTLALSAIVESSNDAIIGTSLDGTVTSWNRAAENLYGYRADEMIGHHIRVTAPSDRGDEVADLFHRYARDESVVGFETVRRHKDGHLIDISLTVSPVHDSTGTIVGASAIIRDITEQVRLTAIAEEDRRRRQEAERAAVRQALEREAAERASRAKSEFLSRMSHELRTPLNAVIGFAELLARGSLNDEDQESVEQIHTAGVHLLGLINEVLDIARIESGGIEVLLARVPVADLVRTAADLIRPAAQQRDIALHGVEELDPHTHVLADPQRLLQVLLNLLSNAVKYNRPGGSISLATSPRDGDQMRIAVADTGAGIGPDDLDKVFAPFERLGAERTSIEGSGVGLPLSLRLVEHMGGSIGVHSTPGVGSTFWIDLPIAAPDADAKTETETNLSADEHWTGHQLPGRTG